MIQNGVDYYKTGIALVPVHFPNGKVDCQHCPFLTGVDFRFLSKCRLTEALVERAELNTRHQLCPVIFEEDEKETE